MEKKLFAHLCVFCDFARKPFFVLSIFFSRKGAKPPSNRQVKATSFQASNLNLDAFHFKTDIEYQNI
jgi:hypothetical protein